MKFKQWFMLLNSLIFVILGGSIILNILLFNRAKQYYFELNKTRLDPLGLNNYPTTPKPVTNTDQIRVVFFGDSRAASWTSPDISGYEFINRGIGSQTSVQTIQRFADHVRPLKPDIIVIQVGVNDLKTIALFPQRKTSIIDDCKTHIQQIVEESKKLGAVVIVTTIFPVGEVPLERQPFWSDEIPQAINEVNAYIATLAGEQTIVFDTFPILADNQGMVLQEYSADELHLNQQGYTVLNQELVQRLDQIQ